MHPMWRVLLVITLYYTRKNKRKQRRLHVHPLIEQRAVAGEFVTLYGNLRANETKFFNYFRMSTRSFDELLSKTRNKLVCCSLRRLPIPPIERLMVTLRFLATGRTYTDLHYSFRMGIATISKIVNEVCTVISKTLHDECLPTRTHDMWQDISDGFLQNTNFPNCIGALDGKHIRIVNPAGGGSMFYNYKNFYSIVLLAMCDANYCFTYIDMALCGKNSDSSIFRDSTLYSNLENNDLNIPGPKPLPGTNVPVPYVIVADGVFGLSQNFMKPYVRGYMTHKKKVFNYRFSRSRRCIESTFAIMSNKFRVFHTPISVSFNVAENIVKACCVLNNFIRVRDGYSFEDTLTIEGMADMANNLPQSTITSENALRDHFADYFLSPDGKVPWQDSRIF